MLSGILCIVYVYDLFRTECMVIKNCFSVYKFLKYLFYLSSAIMWQSMLVACVLRKTIKSEDFEQLKDFFNAVIVTIKSAYSIRFYPLIPARMYAQMLLDKCTKIYEYLLIANNPIKQPVCQKHSYGTLIQNCIPIHISLCLEDTYVRMLHMLSGIFP